MTRQDAEAVFAAGWDERAQRDAALVCALFNLMNRMVMGLGVEGTPGQHQVSAERLHTVGYAGLISLIGK